MRYTPSWGGLLGTEGIILWGTEGYEGMVLWGALWFMASMEDAVYAAHLGTREGFLIEGLRAQTEESGERERGSVGGEAGREDFT